MSRIDFRQIRAFCAVYEEGSISGAAKRLRTAQPNISVAIKNLEFDLRKKMFDRSIAGVTPTAVARTFFSRLRPVLADLEAAYLEARGSPVETVGALRVGLTPFLANGVVCGLLPSLLVKYPDLEFRLTEGSPGSLINLLVSGDLDLAFLLAAPTDGRLASSSIMIEPFVLVSSIRNPAIPCGPVDLTCVPPLKLAVPWGIDGACHPMTEFLASPEIRVSQTINITAFNPLLDLVRNSDWMTLVPMSALAGDFNDLAVREVVNSGAIAEYFFIRSADAKMNAAASFFVEGVKQTLVHARHLCEQRMEAHPGPSWASSMIAQDQ